MLSTTSCLLKNTAVANIAAPLNSKLASAFSSSVLINSTKVSVRPFSLTPLRLEENKVEPPKNETTVEIPPKEAEAPETPKEEPPKTESCEKKGCNCKNENKGCACKKAILMLALAGIAGTAYYYYENRGLYFILL